MDYRPHFVDALDALRKEGRYRVFAEIERTCGAFPRAGHCSERGKRDITVWCSNDYLGMSQSPIVRAAMHEAIDAVGAGSGGTRNISGTTRYHIELEAELADLHGKGAALLFTSAYVANDATLATLARLIPGLVIFSDELNHASIIDGVRLCKARRLRYKHNTMADLEEQLKASQDARSRIIVTDGSFSMDGTVAQLDKICDLADKYDAIVMIDESHSSGFMGKTGQIGRAHV